MAPQTTAREARSDTPVAATPNIASPDSANSTTLSDATPSHLATDGASPAAASDTSMDVTDYDNNSTPGKHNATPQTKRNRGIKAYKDVPQVCQSNPKHYPLAVYIDGAPFYIACGQCGANDASGRRGLHCHYMGGPCWPGKPTFEEVLPDFKKEVISPEDEALIKQGLEPMQKPVMVKSPKA